MTPSKHRERPQLRAAIAFAVTFTLGLVAGLGFATFFQQRSPPAEAHAPPVQPAVAPRVVCARVATPPAEPAPDPELEVRLSWCEARLRVATAARPTGRREWPSTAAEEAPDVWPDALDGLLNRCGGFSVEVVDCEEYPCVAAVRQGGSEPVDAARAALKACASEDPVFEGAEVELGRVVVTCPDGRTQEAFVLSTWRNDSPAVEALYGEDGPDFDDFVVHAGRRVESALQLWNCAD